MSQVAERGACGWWFLQLPGAWLAYRADNSNGDA
jgi:hypothetical protein